MKRCLRYQVFVFAAFLFGGSSGFLITGAASAGPKETLTIAGTGSSTGVMKLMAKGFQKKRPNVTVEVLPSIGSVGGIKAVKDGKIEIGLSSRLLRSEERSADIIEEPYGRSAVVFGVQDANPTKGFTLTEVEEIYAGKRKIWPDGTPIRLILRPVSDSYSQYLAGITPGMKSASEKAHSLPGVFVGITDQDGALQIEKTPGSFGITSAAIVAAERLKIKSLSVDGIAPALTNVSAGKYPYSMTFVLVYKRDKYRGPIKDFIEFVFSRDGQKLLSDNGHVTMQRTTGE
jgi:phosphate transport system substrate-binding protein